MGDSQIHRRMARTEQPKFHRVNAESRLAHATETLGWGIAQVITLLAPQVVVVGGGVSLMPESLFIEPLEQAVADFVLPPLAQSYRLERAMLGEEVVVHGALALCRD